MAGLGFVALDTKFTVPIELKHELCLTIMHAVA